MSAQKINEFPPKLSYCNTCRGRKTLLKREIPGAPQRFVKCTECKGIGYLSTSLQPPSEKIYVFDTSSAGQIKNVPRETSEKLGEEVQKLIVSPLKRRGRPPKEKF